MENYQINVNKLILLNRQKKEFHDKSISLKRAHRHMTHKLTDHENEVRGRKQNKADTAASNNTKK